MATISMLDPPRIFVATPLAPREGDPGWPKKEAIDLVEPIPPLVLAAWKLAAFEANVRFAEQVCQMIALAGGAPFAPHLLFTRFLDDNEPEERAIGMRCGKTFLGVCVEAWFILPEWRSTLSLGMVAEREIACEMLPGEMPSPYLLQSVTGGNGAIRGFPALREHLARWIAVRGPG